MKYISNYSFILVSHLIDSSIQLYGLNTMSSYDICHWFWKAVHGYIKILPKDANFAQHTP